MTRWEPINMVSRKPELAALVLILGFSFLLHSHDLDIFLTTDERNWSTRSRSFRDAVVTGRWADTYLSPHPGVLTMWIGTVAMTMESDRDWATADTLLIFRGRQIIALLNWFIMVPIWLLARRLWGRWESLLGLSLIALDPFLLAHSRLMHLDALTTLIMTLSVLTLAVYTTRRREIWTLLLSGLTAGLASLNKSPALFMAPLTILVLVWIAWRNWGVSLKGLGTLARDVVL